MKSFAVLAVLVLAACGRTSDPVDQGGNFQRVEAGDTIRLQYGESAVLGSEGARIVFRAILGDSRCPINVTCVWAGDAHIRLDGIQGGSTEALELHTTLEPKETVFAGFRIHLIEVEPAPVEPRDDRPEDYSVRLAISRG